MGVDAPKWVIATVVIGLAVTAVIAYAIVCELQSQAVDDALAGQGAELERHIQKVVAKFADSTFGPEGGGIEDFGARVVAAVESNPRIREVVVLTPDRIVVTQWTRGGEVGGCWRHAPLNRFQELQHEGDREGESPRGCLTFPVFSRGTHRGAVVIHSDRVWLAEGERAERLVRATLLRLAPVFLGFSLLLGGMLILASRAARRWRLRAASTGRVEALGALADGINHEIKNPLNAVALSLQYLERRYRDDAETCEVVGTARRQARAIGETLEEFVRFTRVAQLHEEPSSVAERVRRTAHDAGIEIDLAGDAEVRLDPGKMESAFGDVLSLLGGNAGAGERVRVRVEATHRDWRFWAEGDASSLDPAVVDRLFDPYVRSRPRDVGRGLAFARAVFQAHGGDLVAKLKGGRLRVRGHAHREPLGG